MFNPRLFVLLMALYLAQGLPAGFIAHGLPTILREQGVSLILLGSLKLLALPWLFKFLWAPLVDQSVDRGAAKARRRWVLMTQGTIALMLIGLSLTVGAPGWSFIMATTAMILVINLCAATQDIVTDGLAVANASSGQLGWVNSVQVGGYKLGMIVGGSGLLILSGWLPLSLLFLLMSAFLVVLLLPAFLLPREMSASQPGEEAEVAHAPEQGSTWSVIVNSLKGFFSQTGILPWILVLLTYKLSDGLGSSMLKPMLVDFGWTKPEIGRLLLQSSLIGLVGAVIAGLAHRRFGQYKSLVIFAVLQVVSISAFYLISTASLSMSAVRWLVCAEQFCDGLSTVALFAAMMAHCRVGHEGSDYTVQASLQILLAGILGAVSGVMAQGLGYSSLYLVCAFMGLVTMMCLVNYRRRIKVAA